MKRDYSGILLWSAIIVGAPRWAGAMLAADVGDIGETLDAVLNVFNLISGFAMGPLEVLATAYILNGLRQLNPWVMRSGKRAVNWKWAGMLFFFIGLLILTPAILGPYILSRINAQGIAAVLPDWLQYLWSFSVTIAPVFILGGVAFAQSDFVGIATNKTRPESSGKTSVINRQYRKEDLTDSDWQYIKTHPQKESASKFGVSVKTIFNWRKLPYKPNRASESDYSKGSEGGKGGAV